MDGTTARTSPPSSMARTPATAAPIWLVLASDQQHVFPNYKITHLAFNNVGSHGEGKLAENLYNKRLSRPRHFAIENGYEFVPSNSNLMDIFQQNHFLSHTYSSLFAVYCLQKLYSCYYYASAGFKYSEFSLIDDPKRCCGSYELLSLPYFSTKQLRIYSGGEGKTRIEKLKEISFYSPSYKYLNVCLLEEINCGKCEKCIRTLLALDALGKLDLYKDVFDIEYYKIHKEWYLEQMLRWLHLGKHDYLEVYEILKKQVSFKVRLRSFNYGFKSFIYMLIHYLYYKYILKKDYF